MVRPKKPEATFEVVLKGTDLVPERVPVRVISEALSAVQRLASGQDVEQLERIPPEDAIGLIDVRRGSAIFNCFSARRDVALDFLSRTGRLLRDPEATDEEVLDFALRPVQTLSHIARSLDCEIQIRIPRHKDHPLLIVEPDSYDRVSKGLLVTGDSSIVGMIERVGGATKNRCLMRVEGRSRLLYCDVQTRELARRLGEHLYESVLQGRRGRMQLHQGIDFVPFF